MRYLSGKYSGKGHDPGGLHSSSNFLGSPGTGDTRRSSGGSGFTEDVGRQQTGEMQARGGGQGTSVGTMGLGTAHPPAQRAAEPQQHIARLFLHQFRGKAPKTRLKQPPGLAQPLWCRSGSGVKHRGGGSAGGADFLGWALTDVLQQEGQEARGRAQRVGGRHVEHVGGEGEHLQVPEGAAPRPRAGALVAPRGPPHAVPGDLGGV